MPSYSLCHFRAAAWGAKRQRRLATGPAILTNGGSSLFVLPRVLSCSWVQPCVAPPTAESRPALRPPLPWGLSYSFCRVRAQFPALSFSGTPEGAPGVPYRNALLALCLTAVPRGTPARTQLPEKQACKADVPIRNAPFAPPRALRARPRPGYCCCGSLWLRIRQFRLPPGD